MLRVLRQSWLKKLFSSATNRRQPTQSRAPRTGKLLLELLEDRCVPSAYTVSNTNYSGAGSLGAAITAAVNANDSAAVIGFDLVPNSTIGVSSTDVNPAAAQYGPTAFFINGVANTNITLDGTGAPGLIISGGGQGIRPFAVAAGNALTLENLTLAGGRALGANGSGSSAGGPGMGGAVYND